MLHNHISSSESQQPHQAMLTGTSARASDTPSRQVTETMRQGRGLYTLDEQTLAAVRPDIVVTQVRQKLLDACRGEPVQLRSAHVRGRYNQPSYNNGGDRVAITVF